MLPRLLALMALVLRVAARMGTGTGTGTGLRMWAETSEAGITRASPR
jgi:hypothetical protein